MKRFLLLLLTISLLLCDMPISKAATVDQGYSTAVKLLSQKLGKPDEFIDDSSLFESLNMPEFNTKSASNFAIFDMQNSVIYIGGKLSNKNTQLAIWQNVNYSTIAAMGRLILDNYNTIDNQSSGSFAFGAYDNVRSFYADTRSEVSLGRLTYDGLFVDGGGSSYSQASLPSQYSGSGSSSYSNSGYNAGSSSTSSQTYIGNKNTKKFHYPWCHSVDQMKEKNKVVLNSRNEAINKGYVPCKNCNP